MKGDLFITAEHKMYIKSPLGRFDVIEMDLAKHAALTIRVSPRYLHDAVNSPRKGHAKYVQVWHRLSIVDPFSLRMEMPFSLISNAFKGVK